MLPRSVRFENYNSLQNDQIPLDPPLKKGDRGGFAVHGNNIFTGCNF